MAGNRARHNKQNASSLEFFFEISFLEVDSLLVVSILILEIDLLRFQKFAWVKSH